MKTYKETHPWISFKLDLRRAPHTLWLLLGEAQSKMQHIRGVPLMPEIQKQFLQVSLAKGVLATTAIEGNTLSESEVMRHLEGKLKLPPSREYLQREIENIIDACNVIGKRTFSGAPCDPTADELKQLNAYVLRGLPGSEESNPGEYRLYDVGVGRYKGAPWRDVPFLTTKLCQWLNEEFVPEPGHEIAYGILKAIMAHLYVAWIHPFGDGNGRTARLIEFQILLSVGVPDVAAHLLSNYYNKTRTEYYRHLDLSSKNKGNPIPFILYALQGIVDELKEEVEIITLQQLVVHMENYIHLVFKGRHSAACIRRKTLAIDLMRQTKPLRFGDIRMISPRIAEAYANKTEKTVKRDLNYLENLDLIKKTAEGYVSNREIIMAFMPRVRID